MFENMSVCKILPSSFLTYSLVMQTNIYTPKLELGSETINYPAGNLWKI